MGPVAQSVQRLATGWTARGSNPGSGEIFHTCPDRPWGPPSQVYNGYRVFPGGEERPGRDADPSPLLVPWSWKSRAIPLIPLWAVRPVQSLSQKIFHVKFLDFTFRTYVFGHGHMICAINCLFKGACGGAVGWGTALKAGRSRVRFPIMSLEFFTSIILPAALWPWVWLSL